MSRDDDYRRHVNGQYLAVAELVGRFIEAHDHAGEPLTALGWNVLRHALKDTAWPALRPDLDAERIALHDEVTRRQGVYPTITDYAAALTPDYFNTDEQEPRP